MEFYGVGGLCLRFIKRFFLLLRLYGWHIRPSTSRIVRFFVRRIEDWKVSTLQKECSLQTLHWFVHLYRAHVYLCILCTVGSSWSKWRLCLTGVSRFVDLKAWLDLEKYDETGIYLQKVMGFVGMMWEFWDQGIYWRIPSASSAPRTGQSYCLFLPDVSWRGSTSSTQQMLEGYGRDQNPGNRHQWRELAVLSMTVSYYCLMEEIRLTSQ